MVASFLCQIYISKIDIFYCLDSKREVISDSRQSHITYENFHLFYDCDGSQLTIKLIPLTQ